MRLHPLFGASITSLLPTIWRHGGVRVKYLPLVAIMSLQALLRVPGIAIEAWRARRLESANPPQPPPIFIIGHWRSGTTLCHNIISSDPRFVAPSLFEALSPYEFMSGLIRPIVRWLLRRSLPQNRPMDAMPVSSDMPMEEDMALAAMGAPSFFNCLYFPRNLTEHFSTNVLFAPGGEQDAARHAALKWFSRKLSAVHPDQRLVLKSPGNSTNIASIRRTFPNAKFIHIYRHPEAVITSTCKMYRALLPLLALQTYRLEEIEAHVERTYPEVMERLLHGAADLPEGDLAKVKYEDLLGDPLSIVTGVYRDLNLELPDSARANILAELAKNPVVAQSPGAEKNKRRATRSDLIQKKIDGVSRKLGYS